MSRGIKFKPDKVTSGYKERLKQHISEIYPELTILDVFVEYESLLFVDGKSRCVPIWVYYERKDSMNDYISRKYKFNGKRIPDIQCDEWDKIANQLKIYNKYKEVSNGCNNNKS